MFTIEMQMERAQDVLIARTALANLEELPVKGLANKVQDVRDRFGEGWLSIEGTRTRSIILARDLVGISYEQTENDKCTMTQGVLHDRYSGNTINLRENGVSMVDIDHVVALGNAWRTGALMWDDQTREAYANDPDVLLAVSASLNRQKQDKSYDGWQPPFSRYRAKYAAHQINIKRKYDLWVTPTEKNAMNAVLNTFIATPLSVASFKRFEKVQPHAQ